MLNRATQHALVSIAAAGVVMALVYRMPASGIELPNRIPEAAPYVTAEAEFVAPPFEDLWETTNHPAQCQTCHPRVFNEWNGSMMANAWRDPVWRGAFLLSARETSTFGDCDTPDPPDGTPRAHHNPFASPNTCESAFDLGTTHHRISRPGSLLDGFCSRCHMPANYVDNVPLQNVMIDLPSGAEHGQLDPDFNPTSDHGTGLAFATHEAQRRNTDAGKSGVSCVVCHSAVETRDTPFHNYTATGDRYVPALGTEPRASLLPPAAIDVLEVPDGNAGNLGYAIGGGAFRLSPHAIGAADRPGPLTAAPHTDNPDRYLSGVFGKTMPYERMDATKHHGFRHVMTTRAEFCSGCHDVTNPLTIKNRLGKWVGGFPIERTYAEWAGSRYADRPGNVNFDAAYKRDCQTCHMQQDYGRPATAQTLYSHGVPAGPLVDAVATGAPARTYFSHHFVGGNAYVTPIIGASTDDSGTVQPYPELSAFSFSSSDEKSPYANAYWVHADRRGPLTQHARFAWDRLRNVVDLTISAPGSANPGSSAPLAVTVTNSGSGHKFPTGFPEGRVAWLAVHAFDLATGRELEIHDAFWKRTRSGIGGLTSEDMVDPNFPACAWKIPAGSPDPFAYQFKAVASLGDTCPTLDLAYAAPLNLVTNGRGLPIDARGNVIDRSNPRALPQFRDLNANGDVYDDAFLSDTRLQPLPNRGSTVSLDRYSVVVPAGTTGPIAVTATVYYQSVEAIVAKKFLGNLADTNRNFVLEPCVLGGRCDGRKPSADPPVVEGAPPVPIEVRTTVIQVDGAGRDRLTPRITTTYPAAGAINVFQDVVVKASFSEPVRGVDASSFTLTDAQGRAVPSSVDQIGDGTWALFPDAVFLIPGETYRARVAAGICDHAGGCTKNELTWRFTIARTPGEGAGDASIPVGFPRDTAPDPPVAPVVTAIRVTDRMDGVIAEFSKPVMNVTPLTFLLQRAAEGSPCSVSSTSQPPIAGHAASSRDGDRWTLANDRLLAAGDYCVVLTGDIYDLTGRHLQQPFVSPVRIIGSHR